ncbi:fibulin-1-like isoform X3 [Littorina saxatilis]|uniref:fibulin-1-like isoform X3 n=1 Tax=Littorina saxatilis TaxID=31220 RepID=UPI0038B68B1F
MEGVSVRVAAAVVVLACLTMNLSILPTSGQTLTEFFKPGVLDQCCLLGMQWSNSSRRCSGYPGPVRGIDPASQGACMSVIEVCCLKQIQLDMCESGKRTALDRQLCAVRDSDAGAEQFRECCHCCQMGVASRIQSSSCDAPSLGEPCDSKFVECCSGRPSSNFTIPGLSGDKNNPSDEPDSSNSNSNTAHNNTNDMKDTGDDVNECEIFPGMVCSHLCVDQPKGFYCDCPSGFEMSDDKRTCTFVESSEELDCTTNNACEQRCTTRTSGRSECVCYEGYRLNEDARTCTDIDECTEGTYRCSPSQSCINTKGGYSCLAADCPDGTTRNPRTGQCETDNACLSGFAYNSISRRCEDIDECTVEQHTCRGRSEVCRNLNGTFTCDCEEGFERNRTRACQDIDECSIGTHNCAGGFVCQNMQGSFRCVPKECPVGSRFNPGTGECQRINCRRGFKPSRSGSCVDMDECTENTHRCQRHQQCINTAGSYRCRSLVNCPPGYEPTSNSGCQDINECTSNKHRCSGDQECVNRQGSYFCQCPRGFRHDASGRCIDVNECSYGAAICPSTSRCVNTVGSYKCECNDGFISDESGGCLDIDECLADNICQHKCRNVQGSFFCTCNRGYQLREDKRSCEDIDECTQFRGVGGRGGVCGGRCINKPGSYRCECPEGWRLKRDGRSCEDIDECQENIAFCPQQDSICINTRGNYKCPVVRCPEGFAKTTATGPQNREFVAEEDGVVCGRMQCDASDTNCLRNKTKTVAWQFLSIPTMEFVTAPMTLLNIKTVSYSIYPNLHLRIIEGNEEGLFDAVVNGDQAALRLAKPVTGPAEYTVTLDLQNRDFSGRVIISRHITHVKVYVSDYHL